MNTLKWLKRKYPKSYKQISRVIDCERLRKEKWKVGKLTKNHPLHEYKKGSLIMFVRSNPIWSPNYPACHAIVKCKKGFTQSGYHSITIYPSYFKEINK